MIPRRLTALRNLLPATRLRFGLLTLALAFCGTTLACSSSTDDSPAAAPAPAPEPAPLPADDDAAEVDAGLAGTAVPDAAPAPRAKRVFVSSTTLRGGGIGGAAGADAECQRLADAAQLGGTFRAQLAYTNATAPKSVGPYVLVDEKTVVLEEGKRLFQGIVHPIDMTESGDIVVTGSRVWTGATGQTCNDWNTTNEFMIGTYGLATSVPEFAAADNADCRMLASLYCFEQ